MTNFILVRHGESLGNAAGIMLGHTDVDLSEHGYRQAEATAKHLAAEHIDVIYSSDLIRAKNTAAPHAKLRGLEVKTSKELREMYVGDWENVSVEEIKAKYGDMYKVQWHGGFGTFEFPGGESVVGSGERFKKEMEKIAKENDGKTVLVAAHAAIIRAFWFIISGVKPEDAAKFTPFPTNASYSLLKYEDGSFVPLKFSCDEHLREIGITGELGIGK